MLPDNYKQLREELDDLLIELDVPKIYWHQLDKLNLLLASLPYSEDRNKAINLVHEISPIKLTRLDIGESNVTNSM